MLRIGLLLILLLGTHDGVETHLVQTPLVETIATPADLLDQDLAETSPRDDVEKEIETVIEQVEDFGDHSARLDVGRRRSSADTDDANDEPENEIRQIQDAKGNRDDHQHPSDFVVLQLILHDHIHVLVVRTVHLSRLTELLLLLLPQTSSAEQLSHGENVHHADDADRKGQGEIAVDDRQIEIDSFVPVHDITFLRTMFLFGVHIGHDEGVDGQEEGEDQDEQTDTSGTARIADHRGLQRKIDDNQTFESKSHHDPMSSETQGVTEIGRTYKDRRSSVDCPPVDELTFAQSSRQINEIQRQIHPELMNQRAENFVAEEIEQ